jgi:hypothetical protein
MWSAIVREKELQKRFPSGCVHACQGISIGNAWREPFSRIVKGYDPIAHPILGPLIEGGPAALVKEYGLRHSETAADVTGMTSRPVPSLSFGSGLCIVAVDLASVLGGHPFYGESDPYECSVFDDLVPFHFSCVLHHMEARDVPDRLGRFLHCALDRIIPAPWRTSHQFDYLPDYHPTLIQMAGRLTNKASAPAAGWPADPDILWAGQ